MSATLQELVDAAELLDVTALELSAKRAESATGTEPGPVEPNYELDLQFRDDGGAIRIILDTEIDVANVGWIKVKHAIDYGTGDIPALELEEDIVQDFVNMVGLMALLPFVRAAVADITLKVFGAGLVMPVMQRGAIEFNLSGGVEEQAQETTADDPGVEPA